MYAVNDISTVLYAVSVLIGFFVVAGLAVFYHWLEKKREKAALSPYSKKPMRRGSEISYTTAVKVLKYLYYLHQYDNRIFDLNRAAVCRETGRIFPHCINYFDVMHVDWTFLTKRYPGTYVSWGSLTEAQQKEIQKLHGSLEGFQTENSSPNPSPRQVEPYFAFTIPGPLYVDLETGVLLGWKCVPDTDLEVLIVQKPLQIHTPNIPQE